MTKPTYTITDRQLKIYDALERIKMAWVALVVALALFAIGLGCFLYALLVLGDRPIGTSIAGVIDGALLVPIKIVYSHLFPGKKK
jgi:hypothetical protein